MKNINKLILVAIFLLQAIAITACSLESDNQPVTTAADPAPTTVVDEKPSDNDTVSELSGTKWRLVVIMGMDDSIDKPLEGSLYTLEFNANGKANIHADCNRGHGTWSSESARQLRFGPIASTRAMCPPESISDHYLAQFEWVRSYVMKDGHLFLATMADGAIIEFEPYEP